MAIARVLPVVNNGHNFFGAVVVISVRRIVLRLSSAYPLKDLFEQAARRLVARVRLE